MKPKEIIYKQQRYGHKIEGTVFHQPTGLYVNYSSIDRPLYISRQDAREELERKVNELSNEKTK